MTEPTPLRAPRIRRAPIPDDAVLVVRGDDLDPATSRHQAASFLRRFPDWGRYGLSAYYARNSEEINDLAADQLERFPVIATFPIAALIESGLEVVPTFRSSHVTLAFTGDLDERLTTPTTLAAKITDNPYDEPEPNDHPRR